MQIAINRIAPITGQNVTLGKPNQPRHFENNMPRSLPRDYKAEYRGYHGKPAQVENRNQRNKAVRKLNREGKASRDGKEVDHKIGSKNGSKLSNGKGNLRVVKKSINRRKG